MHFNTLLPGRQVVYSLVIREHLHDEQGAIIGVRVMEGSTVTNYYYLRNMRGDVVGIVDGDGALLVSYTYDEWGKVLSISGYEKNGIGAWNPIRYRGYYYDVETGFYYLGSRYYDPETGRLLNADTTSVLNINQGTTLQYNLFAASLKTPPL